VRYMGTIGGNLLVDPRCNYYNQTYSWRKAVGFCMKKDGDICLVARSSPRCWAVSSSDSAPVALALNAQITLHGVQGTRRIPAADLHRDDGIDYTTKKADEVITAVDLPAVEGRMTSSYWKLRRRPAFDFPILGVAVAIAWDDGVVREARGALGAVGLLARDPRRPLVHFQHLRAQIELVQLGTASAEGIRLDDVAARLEVGAVDSSDHVRAGQGQHLVTALPAVEVLDGQVARKLHPLQRRAHGAVENDDSSGDCIEKVLVCHFRGRTLPCVAS